MQSVRRRQLLISSYDIYIYMIYISCIIYIILNEPAVTYDPTKAATLQAMPGPHPQGADLIGFLERALRMADQP